MELHPILEKKKSRKGIGCFIILLLIAGFVAGVILVHLGVIRPNQIPQP